VKILFTAFYTSELGGGETSFLNLINHLSKNKDNELLIIVPNHGVFIDKINKTDNLKIEIKQNLYEIIYMTHEFDLAIHNYINYGKKFLFLPFAKIKKHSFICHGLWDIPKYSKLFFLKLKKANLYCVNEEIFYNINYKYKQLINLGIELNKFNVQKNKTNMINIGVIGRFQDIKNQLFAVEIFRELNIKYNNLQLFFIGDAAFTQESIKYKQKVIKKVENIDLGNIFFIGNKNNYEVFDAIDIVFIPSKYESFGMVVIESLANGVVCLAPNIGGPKQIMKDKLSDYLYIPNEKKSALEKFIYLITNLEKTKQEFREKGQYFKDKYNIENTVKILLEGDK